MLIDTVPAGMADALGVFSFGAMPAGVDNFLWNGTQNIGGLSFIGSPVAGVAFPRLISVDPANLQGGALVLQDCNSLTSVSIPVLELVGGNIVVTGSSLTSVNFPRLTTIGGFSTSGLAVGGVALTSFSAPALTSIGGDLEFSALGNCWSFPALTIIDGTGGQIVCAGNYQGTTISMPNLVSIGQNINTIVITACPNLTTIDLSSWTPFRRANISISNGCPLSAATVNHILARCVANPLYDSGTVDLSGAAPTGQGITDKATLQGRGVVVNTN